MDGIMINFADKKYDTRRGGAGMSKKTFFRFLVSSFHSELRTFRNVIVEETIGNASTEDYISSAHCTSHMCRYGHIYLRVGCCDCCNPMYDR